MTAWLVRATKQVVESGPPSDIAVLLGVPVAELTDASGNAVSNVHAIWQPDLNAVAGFPSKYWTVQAFPDDTVGLLDQAGRDAVDAAELSARLDAVANQVDNTEDILRAVLNLLVDEFNRHADRLNAIRQAALDANNLSSFQNDIQANVPVMPTRTFQDLKDAVRAALGS